jgi:hypothetical protein
MMCERDEECEGTLTMMCERDEEWCFSSVTAHWKIARLNPKTYRAMNTCFQ